MSSMSVNLQSLQAQLATADKNYMGMAPSGGDLRATTTNVFGRWQASRPNPAAQERNRATIDALVGKLRGVQGFGNSLADAVKGQLAQLRESGQPLSGRQASTVINSVLRGVQEQYMRGLYTSANINDIVAKTTADGLIKSMGPEHIADFAITPQELKDWEARIQDSVRTALTAKAADAGRTPNSQEIKQAIQDALTKEVIATRGPAMLAQGKAGLGLTAPIDEAKLLKQLSGIGTLEHMKGCATPGATLTKYISDKVSSEHYAALRVAVHESIPSEVEDGSDFHRAVNDRIHLRNLSITVPGKKLDELSDRLFQQVRGFFHNRRPMGDLPTRSQIDAKRNELLDAYFKQIDTFTTRPGFTDFEKSVFKNVMLQSISALKPAYFEFVVEMQKKATTLFQGLMGDPTLEEATAMIEQLGKDYFAMLPRVPQGYGQDDMQAVTNLGFLSALQFVPTSELLDKLAAPGSIYMRAMGQLMPDPYKTPPAWAGVLGATLKSCVEARTSPQNPFLSHFDLPPNLRLMATSARPDLQRTGVTEAFAPLVDPLVGRDLQLKWTSNAQTQITEMGTLEVRRPPTPYPTGFANPNDPQWTVSEQFVNDVLRDGALINGALVNDVQGFVAQMPDARAAAQVSRVMHQGLAGIIGGAMPPNIRNMYLDTFATPHLVNQLTKTNTQMMGLASLGGGAFRVAYEFGRHVNNLSDVQENRIGQKPTDLFSHISFVIQTGPEFTISDVKVDASVLVQP